MVKIKFLRRNTGEYSRLGKKRKKIQKWRAPKGRDNKMRLRRKSYPRTVEIGYKQDSKTRYLIEGKEQVIVRNLNDLEKIKENQIIIIGKVGMKKRADIIKIAKEKNINIINEKKKEVKKKIKETNKEKQEEKKQENNKKIEEKTKEKENIKDKSEKVEEKK